MVSSLELFYDLVYVALIARVAQGLHGEITLGALATFCVLFGLLWVGWYNGSVPVSYTHLDVYKRQLMEASHGRTPPKCSPFNCQRRYPFASSGSALNVQPKRLP